MSGFLHNFRTDFAVRKSENARCAQLLPQKQMSYDMLMSTYGELNKSHEFSELIKGISTRKEDAMMCKLI